jgi:biotin synthase-related radical SAM superfamily protein
LKIRATNEGLQILENDTLIAEGRVLPVPEWYNKEIDGYPITSIITQHNTQLAGSVYEWCSLFETGEQCQFCVINRSQRISALRNVVRKASLIMKAMEMVPRGTYQGVTLNGGMTFEPGRGLEVMLPVIKEMRARFPETDIGVEITPPEDPAYIEEFAEAGGNSLMMNLEMWDEARREALIPGKNKYCPRDQYLRAFEKAVEVLGKGKVSTCFVVGTESMNTLQEGIQTVVDYNVVPSPLAGRTFEQIPGYPFINTANWKEFLEIFSFSRQAMQKAGLVSTDKAGCVACGMCDIIGDTA